jgi:hypothetical protein
MGENISIPKWPLKVRSDELEENSWETTKGTRAQWKYQHNKQKELEYRIISPNSKKSFPTSGPKPYLSMPVRV